MFGASHGRCGSVFWSLSGAEVHQPSDSRSAEVLGPSFLQKNPAFRLRSMTGIFLCVVSRDVFSLRSTTRHETSLQKIDFASVRCVK